jgi:A/G-specific adenine glycosylase
MSALAPALLDWWDRHGRKDLPWQQDPTPYRVWVSEIMLQQTQVATVARYYDRFMTAFPEVVALADAEADRVLHLWSGLGYYARARNLHRAAQVVRDEHGGEVPRDFAALLRLPGIGRSTAGAILALATGQRHPILDGNARRVLARVFGVAGPPAAPRVQRELWSLADACTPRERVAHYTQAVMDLGATLCTRRRPACGLCPLAHRCEGHRTGLTASLPATRAKRQRPQRASVVMLVLAGAGTVLLEKRPPAGIWGGLWGLPEIDSVADAAGWCAQQFGRTPERIRVRPVLRHGFTHFDLDMTPVEVYLPRADRRVMEGDRWLWYNVREPAEVGLAAPVSRLLGSL